MPPTLPPMDRRGAWIQAARPRTLPAAIAPVLVGSGLAAGDGRFRFDAFVAAMLGSLAIQVAANFANDASDARRGADTPDRVGPQRMVSTGIISSRRMWEAVALALAVAASMGIWLIAIAGWWIALIGLVSILAMLTYVGGPIPYGYRGLGEVMVFLFFGLVATVGTRFAHGGGLGLEDWLAGSIMGLLATGILVANNLRDLDTDAAVGKRTLAVLLGPERTRLLYAAVALGPFAVVGGAVASGTMSPPALIALAAVPPALRLVRTVRRARLPGELIPVLGGTARLQLLVGIVLAASLAL
jgi:1,4-dihydroxy-2-naphthoate octaprenyltransferase